MADQPVRDTQSSSTTAHPTEKVATGTGGMELSSAEIDRVLSRLRREAHDIRADEVSEPAAAAVRLVEIERELLELSAKIVPDEPCISDGNSIIADVEEWSRLCDELRLTDAAKASRKTTVEFLQKSYRAWRDTIRSELNQLSSALCFRRLLETTSRRCEAARSADPVVDDKFFEDISTDVRRSFERCLTEDPPTAETRQEWMTDLSDYVDLVLTMIDDVPPQQSAVELSLIEGHLDWHLKHVERTGGRSKARLRRKLARVRAEMQERQLQFRLERRFGARLVGFSERLVLTLICFVVALMAVEAMVDLSAQTAFWFTVADSCACLVFLVEFFTKLSMVRGRARWFRRHFLIDLIPSIPIGLILSGLPAAARADSVRLGRLARFLRLPRLARYVRILRPLLRILRGFGLIARGLDRLVRRYGHLLNQNVILYPTRVELDRADKSPISKVVDLQNLRGGLRVHWTQLLRNSPKDQQHKIAGEREQLFCYAFELALCRESAEVAPTETRVREIPAGTLIARFESSTPQSITEELGDELVAQLARITRLFARPPLRWLPIIRRCVPTLTENMTDADVTAAAAQRIARVFRNFYNCWFWVADLYGTVTPSQFVGRVGTMLVKTSSRPAYRLVLFGGFFLLADLILSLTALSIFRPIREFLYRFVGTPVMVIGGACFLILGLGFWLKRLAKEATEFYEQAVQAQFLSLTEVIRTRHLDRDTEIVYDRVLRPGCVLRDPSVADQREDHLKHILTHVRQSLSTAHLGGGQQMEGLDGVVLLFRDWLDGALLTDNDTRSTSQLLGNPAIRQYLGLSGRFDRKQLKRLQLLDLVRQKSLFGGPYLWFNFISRSISQSVAMLLVDFNQNAVPLADLPRISDDNRLRYELWLAGEKQLLPNTEDDAAGAEKKYITTSFTALHFLDFDEQRDREVEHQFGPAVLSRLQADRSLMIRRIFGTYPMHDRPKDQRVVNLFSLYNSWLEGGRALLLPWYVLGFAFRLVGWLLAWIARSVKEIRQPELRMRNRDAAKSHFYSAIRKIERVRGPVVEAALRLRMTLDPEYLGVAFPLQHGSTLGIADVDADLRFLNSSPETLELVNEERQRAQEDMQRLLALIESGLLQRIARNAGLAEQSFDTPEHVRAAAIAYLSDYTGVRRHLSAHAVLDTVIGAASELRLTRDRSLPRPILKRKFRRYWRLHGSADAHKRHAAWRAVRHNARGAADALLAWSKFGEKATTQGEQLLRDVLMHPGRINQQLMAVRVVQTLTVLDVLNYREHVYHLGRYSEMGDEPGRLLEWNTTLNDEQ